MPRPSRAGGHPTDAEGAISGEPPVGTAYREQIEAGGLRDDPGQVAVAARLDDLIARLASYRPAPAPRLLGRLRRQREPEPPRGLYIHGPVGSGKSMMMDLFFAHAPVDAKRRVHFHAFMLEVQRRLHHLREQDPQGEPLASLAEAIADEARLLCFDEFVVFNIADAMILGRLFEALFGHGVVVVATSNFPPDRLYEGGLNRDRFLPFIELLKRRMEVVELAAATDYRQGGLRGVQVFHWPLDDDAAGRLEMLFADLAQGEEPRPEEIAVGRRTLVVPRTANGVAWFGFDDLCARALGPADYLALDEHFHAIVLAGVPRLTPDKRNEARRFITLVDALYECKLKLIMSAEAPPEELYPQGEGAFEFQRTVSRLHEMQSRDYLASAKIPLPEGRTLGDFALTTDLA